MYVLNALGRVSLSFLVIPTTINVARMLPIAINANGSVVIGMIINVSHLPRPECHSAPQIRPLRIALEKVNDVMSITINVAQSAIHA